MKEKIKPKKKAIPYWLKREIHQRDQFICQKCGKKSEKNDVFAFEYKISSYNNKRYGTIRFEVDHILPRHLGGTNDKNNLQLLCRKCNRSKGHK